ncbi:unnamed protein product, partial [Ixodes hexagonus]
SVTRAVTLVKLFCEASGASVNWDKCCGVWHGAWATAPSEYEGVPWSSTPSKYLGVPLQHFRNSNNMYWSGVATDLDSRASRWKHRDLSVFTRATVCNMFLIAKLWYVLQLLHCARTNIQKFHRIFAVFIWKSTWEPMRRDHLFRRVRHGGLGLSHLFVRQLVSRFFFVRDQNHPFLRAIIQTKLVHHLPSFIVSYETTPVKVFGFLKEVVDAVKFLSVRFSLEYLAEVSRKTLARDLIESLFPAPLYRTLYAACQGQDVLSRVKRMIVPPSAKSFFFKLHSPTLPVKEWLDKKGIFVPWTINCLLCKQPETVDHVFIFCWDAQFFWDVLQRTLKKDFVITPSRIRFLDVQNENCVAYDSFLLLGLFSICKSRMAVRNADTDAK